MYYVHNSISSILNSVDPDQKPVTKYELRIFNQMLRDLTVWKLVH